MPSLTLTIRDVETRITVKPHLLSDMGSILRADDRSREAGLVVLVTDETVGALYAEPVMRSIRSSGYEVAEFRVAPGEASKQLATVAQVFNFLSSKQLGRDGLVVALGGGVVSDLAGFVASTWMRGVPLVICPTTLESAIDASIGGKTGINIPGGKNLVGAFHPALLVATDPTCLRTLEAREVSAGMGESIKHGLIEGEAFTAWQETHIDAIRSLDETILTELLERNVRIKCDIVQRDPFERRGERMFLNFGHTIGHAIESCGNYRRRHGECVALGMVGACRLSRDLGLCDQALVDRTEMLLRHFDLPTKIEETIETDQIIRCIRNDKKTKGNVPRFVLLEGVGKPVIHAGVSEDLLRATIESLTG